MTRAVVASRPSSKQRAGKARRSHAAGGAHLLVTRTTWVLLLLLLLLPFPAMPGAQASAAQASETPPGDVSPGRPPNPGLEPAAGAAAAGPVLYRLWLLDVGSAPVRTRALFASPPSEASSELSQLLAQGLLLSAGYFLLPVEEFQLLAAQMGEAVLTFSRGEATGTLPGGVQEGRVTSLGALATYPGHATRLTLQRAVPFLTSDEVPFPLHASGSAAAFPIQSALSLEVEPEAVGPAGRVTSRVQFEAEHLGRRFVFAETLPLGRTPTPIAGLLIQQTEQLSLGPFAIARNTYPRLAALAVTAEPAVPGPALSEAAPSSDDSILPTFSRAPAAGSAAGRITPAASMAPFVAEVVGWFGPLPDVSEPELADDTFGLALARTAHQQGLVLDASWRWADSARLTLGLEGWDPATGSDHSTTTGWIGLHGTLARRLELVGGASLGPHPARWYVGLWETTAPSSSLELRASYALQVSGDAFSQVASGSRLSLSELDPTWAVGATWHPGAWRLDLTVSRPPGDVDQVELRLGRALASGGEDRPGAGLEAGVRYRWTLDELEYRLGLRIRTWR